MAGVGEQGQVGVGVHVDEAGRQGEAVGVHGPAGGGGGARAGPRIALAVDHGDPAAADHDVRPVRLAAGAVHHQGAAQHQFRREAHRGTHQKKVRM